MPDSLGGQEGKTRKVKSKIQEELGAKPATSKEGKRKLLRTRANRMVRALSFWLVRNSDGTLKCSPKFGPLIKV